MSAAPGQHGAADPPVEIKQARAFLEQLDQEGGFTFQTFDDKPAKEKRNSALTRVLHGTLEQHASELARLNSAGAGIYVMVNHGDFRGRATENVLRVRAFFVDLDGAPIEPVLAASQPPDLVVDTSPGRWHAYWFVDGCSLEDFPRAQRELARMFDSDSTIVDLPRVMRLPGFYHRKTETPYLVRLREDVGGVV